MKTHRISPLLAILGGLAACTPATPGGAAPTADAAALLTYLRSSRGNTAPPVETATIAEALGAGE